MIRINQLKKEISFDEKNLLNEISNELKINKNDILSFEIVKKSIDARKKTECIYYSYVLNVFVKDEKKVKLNNNIVLKEDVKFSYNYILKDRKERPIIIGCGPSGIFCALELVKFGYKPIIIEQGEEVDKRKSTVEYFFKTGILNEKSNVQFGEGGAGTFSDGKLNTSIKDKYNLTNDVLKTFVEFGADESILYTNKPHIGTDKLIVILKNIRHYLISNGCDIYFETKMIDFSLDDNSVKEVLLQRNDEKFTLYTDKLILAIGHSAKDTFELLYNKKVNIESKSFAVGFRVEHKQELISKNQYGKFYKMLPPAEYKVTYRSKNKRSVYSFCMCPGGIVVNASSEKGYLVVNGMSNSKRDEENANSAIIVGISSEDFGEKPLDGLNFIKQIEEKAFNLKNGKIPIQKFIDFKENRETKELGKIKPNVLCMTEYANLRGIYPEFIDEAIIEALEYFGTKIKGFNYDDVVLSGVETRTSSPIRIVRDDNYMCSIANIYVVGEGAGYAGGITSSAIDGIKLARKIAEND